MVVLLHDRLLVIAFQVELLPPSLRIHIVPVTIPCAKSTAFLKRNVLVKTL